MGKTLSKKSGCDILRLHGWISRKVNSSIRVKEPCVIHGL